ncbi:hypothetical protein [Helicobacter pylori]|uniref:hypothetical protein n=1 Tax=Helicobacter pylori TaxID=210 RepID=UPI0002BC68B9|nr:hypothetical protein [Helicobacter pylori]
MGIKEKEIELETLKREIAQAEASLEQDFIKHMVDKTNEKVEDLFFSDKPGFYRFVFTEQNNYLREKLTDKVSKAMNLSDEIQRDKDAEQIDSSLRNSIEWLTNAGESLKIKIKEYEGFFSAFNASMKANEQEVTNILNANTENIFYLKKAVSITRKCNPLLWVFDG